MRDGKTSQKNPRMNRRANQGLPVIFVLERLAVEDERRAPSSPPSGAKAYLEVLKTLLNSRLAKCGRLGPIYIKIEGQRAFRLYPSLAGNIDLNNLQTREFQRLLDDLFQRGKICGRGRDPAIRDFKGRFRDLFGGFTVIGCVSGEEFNDVANMKDYAFSPNKTYVFVIGKLKGGVMEGLITQYLQALDIPMSEEALAGWVCNELEGQWNL